MDSVKLTRLKRFISFILGVMFIVASFSEGLPVQAKTSTMKLSKATLDLTVGKSASVKTKKKYKKLKIKVSKKHLLKITTKGRKITVKALRAGNVTVTVKGYNSRGKLVAKGKFKVKVPPVPGTVQPSEETMNYDARDYSINNIHSGEATFYDKNGVGNANLDDYDGVYYTAAMNSIDYFDKDTGFSLAGAYIEVMDKDGDTVNVLITDKLPSKKKGNIDLTRQAFKAIEPEATGRMKITWKIIPLPTEDPVSFLWKPSSSKWWAEVQVRNGRYPVKSLEYYNKSKKAYVALERREYNYFRAEKGMGSGPFKFRVTDIYGHTIIEEGIAMNTKSKPVAGKNNFPY